MAGMYPENQELSIFGEKVQWPGLDKNGKFTNGSFTDPLEKPSFIPAETLNLILDNLGGLITKLGGTPNNTSTTQLAELFVSAATANKGIMRDAAGRAQVAAPQAAADIARKADVDAAVRFASSFGVCETESATIGKVVTIEGAAPVAGRRICVKFTHGNSASEPTLNVNNLGAKPITMDGQSVYTGCFDAGGVYEFMYDGTNWECLSGVVRARSFGENAGYVKYRNGLIYQWILASGVGGLMDFRFPTAFKFKICSFQKTCLNTEFASVGENGNYLHGSVSYNLTGFRSWVLGHAVVSFSFVGF